MSKITLSNCALRHIDQCLVSLWFVLFLFFFLGLRVFSRYSREIFPSVHAESPSIGAALDLLSFKVTTRLEYFIRTFMGC